MATCALSCSVRKGSQTRSVIKPPSLGKMCSRSILYGANYHSPFPSVKPPMATGHEVWFTLREKAFEPVGRGFDSLRARESSNLSDGGLVGRKTAGYACRACGF